MRLWKFRTFTLSILRENDRHVYPGDWNKCRIFCGCPFGNVDIVEILFKDLGIDMIPEIREILRSCLIHVYGLLRGFLSRLSLDGNRCLENTTSKLIYSKLIDHFLLPLCFKQEQSHKSYRPLCVLTFRWNYLIHQLDPMGYHLLNVILHVGVCLLYFRFVISRAFAFMHFVLYRAIL